MRMMNPNKETPLDGNGLKQIEEYQKVIDDLMNNAFVINNDSNQRNENSRNGQSLLLKLSNANEKLKRANKRLKQKIIARQKLLANCELRVAQIMSELFNTKLELQKSRKEKELDATQIKNLKLRVKQFEYEILQCKGGLKFTTDGEDLKVQQLGKLILQNMGNMKNMKKGSATFRFQLAEKETQLKEMQHLNVYIMGVLGEFANKLAEADLLSEEYGMKFMEKYRKTGFSSEPSKPSAE